jgi:hypothetical protein
MSRSGHILNSTGVTARLLNLISGFIAKQTKTRPACASAYEELSTPLAGEHFTGHRKGAIYGYPGTPERYGKPWLRPARVVKIVAAASREASSHGPVLSVSAGQSDQVA